MEEKKAKVVFNESFYNKLIDAGCRVVGTKKHRETKNTILVFEKDENFEKAFAKVLEEWKAKKEGVKSNDEQ